MTRMTWVLIVLLLGAPLVEAVEIYRHQPGDGRPVEFSDKPRTGAQKLEVKVPTRTAPPASPTAIQAAPGAQQSPPGDQPLPYQTLEIQQPRNDDTVRDNEGNVSVVLQLAPPLQPEFGHSLILMMDGRPVEAPGLNTNFELRNVDRGSHTLQAFVLDAVGKTVFASPKSTFHIHRQIVRRPPAP